jgi:MFS family permease
MLGSAWLLLRDGPNSAVVDATDDAAIVPLQDMLSIVMARRFVAIVFATGSLWFIIIALTQHQSIYLARDVGLNRSLLPLIFSLFFGASVIGKLGFGLLADRFDLHRVMAAATIMLAGALGLLSQASPDDMGLLYTYAILAGLGFSGAFTCIQILVAAHYSGPHYGKILATIVLIDTLCGALGTRVVAMVREWQESYVPALTGLALLAGLSALLVLTLSRAESTETKIAESA